MMERQVSARSSASSLLYGVLCVLFVCALARPSAAAKYEVFVAVETEEDLYDLYLEDQIGEATLSTLIELYQRRVHLARASRELLYTLPNLTYAEVDAILAYREGVARIRDVDELVAAGALSSEKLRSIRPFLEESEAPEQSEAFGRLSIRGSNGDTGLPAVALQARASTLGALSLGAAAVGARRRLGRVSYDPWRDALSAEAPRPRIVVPKLYASWDTPEFTVIAGTYRAGFGQRLTFDTTSQYTPHGIYPDHELLRVSALGRVCRESAGELEASPCAGQAGRRYEMPDFRFQKRLFGVALGVKDIALGGSSLAIYGFASRERHDVYQYQIYDRRGCDEPGSNEAGCRAPFVYRRRPDPLEPTSRFSFHTLPGFFTETIVGGNMTFRPARRAHIGLTGYRSSVRFAVGEMALDFQSWARLPRGGPFGAVGGDAAFGHGPVDVFVELTRSFDSIPGGGGGLAGLLRGTVTWERSEIEASLRYYQTDFVNPHARPIASATLHEGLRARDELGARLRYAGRVAGRLRLGSSLDVWRKLSSGRPSLLLSTRGDYKLSRLVQLGSWAELSDRDLRVSGRGECFQSPFETDEEGEPVPCAGSRYRAAGRFRLTPASRYFVDLKLRHDWVDDVRSQDRFRRDLVSWITLGAGPLEDLRLRVRARYVLEDISGAARSRSLWAYAELGYRLWTKSWLRIRYDRLERLEQRQSAAARSPAPEHWLGLELEGRL